MARELPTLDVSAPHHVAATLRRVAERYLEDAGELSSAWQDGGAGHPWEVIARELERCAGRIEKGLERMGY